MGYRCEGSSRWLEITKELRKEVFQIWDHILPMAQGSRKTDKGPQNHNFIRLEKSEAKS